MATVAATGRDNLVQANRYSGTAANPSTTAWMMSIVSGPG